MSFTNELITWYRKHKRDLPWRNISNPYHIWLSEIILQQTRVEQGLPYYLKFLAHFPTINSFANASEDQILHLWQGLGYYSRGRNMLKTAKHIQQNLNGVFPHQYQELIKLTGIGEYTAAAISSFSSNEAKAVVDGNVYRLLSRYFGIETPINSTTGKKQFQEVADQLLDIHNAGEHNQAMIEFGALQCKPKSPNCEQCPFLTSCFAYQNNKVQQLPVKLKTVKIKHRYFYYFMVTYKNQILIKRRDNSDIWAGLHDFPLVEFASETKIEEVLNQTQEQNWFQNTFIVKSISPQIKHILTHQRLFAQFIHIEVTETSKINLAPSFWINIVATGNYGMPKLIFEFMNKFLDSSKI
jgi:A/G-specific adenine glycosylase